MAWIPLFILWLGIFETSKVALIAVGVLFPIYLGVMDAILGIDRKIVEVGRTFRLGGFAMIRRILLPAVLPAFIVSLRTGLGLGWMFVVAAEFMGASEGVGFLLTDGQQLGKPAQILAAIIVFATAGLHRSARWAQSFLRQHVPPEELVGYHDDTGTPVPPPSVLEEPPLAPATGGTGPTTTG